MVRHGESLGNATRTMLGHTDLDLSELGYAQAELTAAELLRRRIDAVYSSDLIRAYHTAEPHAKLRGIPICASKNLRELFIGDWENMRVDDIIACYGEDMFKVDWHGNFGLFAFPGGESVQGGCDRFYSEVERIALENEGKTLLIAAHAAVIRAFYARVLGIPPERIAEALPFPTNASYSVVLHDSEGFCAVEYSHDEHLAELGITRVNT